MYRKSAKIVGQGREKNRIINLANELDLKNVDFLEWISYKDVSEHIARADLCLAGHFSNIDKAKRVIPGKTFSYLAMRKPVIVGNNVANNEVFKHKENIYMCDLNDEHALANAIIYLMENEKTRKQIKNQGYVLYEKMLSSKKVTQKLKKIINDIYCTN